MHREPAPRRSTHPTAPERRQDMGEGEAGTHHEAALKEVILGPGADMVLGQITGHEEDRMGHTEAGEVVCHHRDTMEDQRPEE